MKSARLVAQGHEYPLDGELVTIGSDDDNLIVIDDESVSGHHAEIRMENDRRVIHDLESTNGMLVNGTLVDQSVLSDGDVVDLGGFQATFRQDAP